MSWSWKNANICPAMQWEIFNGETRHETYFKVIATPRGMHASFTRESQTTKATCKTLFSRFREVRSTFSNLRWNNENNKVRMFFFLCYRHNNGHVTKSQFRQCLQHLELTATEKEFEVHFCSFLVKTEWESSQISNQITHYKVTKLYINSCFYTTPREDFSDWRQKATEIFLN